MNWFRKPKQTIQSVPELTTSILYNEATFYNQFVRDLSEAKEEVIIESPYITLRRLKLLRPTFEKLIDRGIKVYIITRDPKEHDEVMLEQSEAGIRYFETLGPQVLLCGGGHHRKLAMIDRRVFWEGSLNILSQAQSREFMRRIDSESLAEELFEFLKYDQIGFFREKLDLL